MYFSLCSLKILALSVPALGKVYKTDWDKGEER